MEVVNSALYVNGRQQVMNPDVLRRVLTKVNEPTTLDLTSFPKDRQTEVAIAIWEALPSPKPDLTLRVSEEPKGFFYSYHDIVITEEGVTFVLKDKAVFELQ
jgi:hypothetical protein